MKSPAFQWYPKDILSSARVAMLSLGEEGAYRRALDFCWLNGSLPAEAGSLAMIIGKNCTPDMAQKIMCLFKKKGKVLIHERLEAERKKQAEHRQKSSEAGKESARMKALRASGKSTDVDAGCHQNPTLHTAFASATADNNYINNKTRVGNRVYDKAPAELMQELFATGIAEMMAGQYKTLRLADVIAEIAKDCPTGTAFNNEQHLLNRFKSIANKMLSPKKGSIRAKDQYDYSRYKRGMKNGE